MTGELQLSQWWRTESAQRACERAKENRAARITKMRGILAEKKQQLDREIQNWKEVTQ